MDRKSEERIVKTSTNDIRVHTHVGGCRKSAKEAVEDNDPDENLPLLLNPRPFVTYTSDERLEPTELNIQTRVRLIICMLLCQ